VRRVAVGVPLLEVARERVEPDLSSCEEGSVCIGRETGAMREAEHRRARLPGAVFFVKPATTTSPTHREPNRSLAFFAPFPYPVSLLVGVPSSRPAPVRRCHPHERSTTRAFFVAPSHRSHPWSPRVNASSCCVLCPSSRGLPRDAPPCQAPCVHRALYLLSTRCSICFRTKRPPCYGRGCGVRLVVDSTPPIGGSV
jgi:hypothetical protein